MIGFRNTIHDRVKLFVAFVAIINILGSLLVYSNYMGRKIYFFEGNALEITLESSSKEVKLTKNIYDDDQIHKVYFTIYLTNNTDQTITGVKLIMPNIEVNFLETPTAIRFPHLLPTQNDIVFLLADLPPQEKSQSKVVGYVTHSGVYTIRANIENDQKIRAASNIVTIKAE